MEVCQEKLKRNEDIFMSQEKFVVQNVRSVTSPADKSIVTYFIWVDFNDLDDVLSYPNERKIAWLYARKLNRQA